jgi:tetratricopeptide (TPR) repeat protein
MPEGTMKTALLLASTVLLSVVLSYSVVRICPATHPRDDAAPAATADDVARLARALSDAEERGRALAEDVKKLREEMAVRSSSSTRVPEGEIEAAVARAVAAHRDTAASAPEAEAAASSSAKPAAEPVFDMQSAFRDLCVPGMSREERMAKWKAVADAGKLDEMVALFEQYAKEHPESPMAQVELGGAYLQKVFKAGNGPEAGIWATKADKSFDAALAVDDHCWDARFSKAVSLSFWPAVFGKQNEAIKNFEVLTEQQGQGNEPKYAQTWLLLGNMYQQTGRMDQALATWKHGLELFPGNESLQAQIANAQH